MRLADGSIRYEIEIEDSKDARRMVISEFLLPLKEGLQDAINGFGYFFEPYLQVDIRVNDSDGEDVRDRIDNSPHVDGYEFIPEPERAWWGETKRDTEALIRGHEQSADLAMSIVDIKDGETGGRSMNEHASRRLHLFLSQMGVIGGDELSVYLNQLVSRHPAVEEDDFDEAASAVVQLLKNLPC